MNYKQIYAMKAERERRIKLVAPNIPNAPGIYVFYRTNDAGIKLAYVGQAKHLLDRAAQHLAEYDHIGLTLKKHKLYGEANESGWKLAFKECQETELDCKERETIKAYADNGFQLYNSTTGGQDDKKQTIKGGKTPRGYYDGLKQGEKNAQKFVANLFEKHLDFRTKKDPPTKLQETAFAKFKSYIDGGKNDAEKDNEKIK